MDAKELRIGNWVKLKDSFFEKPLLDPTYELYANNIFQVKNIEENKNYIIHYKIPSFIGGHICSGCSIKNIDPILLTEKWLKNFGFIQHDTVKGLYDIKYNGFEITVTMDNNTVMDIQLSSTNISGAYPNKELFKYVHQLQNLYFALTGEELTLKNE